MAPKKKLTFANDRGKALTTVKHINREGKSLKIAPAKRASKPVAVDEASLARRRKLAEEQAARRVSTAKYELDKLNMQQKKTRDVEKQARDMYTASMRNFHKANLARDGNAKVNALAKTIATSMRAIDNLSKHKKELDRMKKNAQETVNMAKNQLKAQKTLG
jgi:molecular chaperone GrpE (heat shock protein)